MKHLKIFEDYRDEWIECYHRSNSYEHMVRGDFSLDKATDYSVFGKALYFAESPSISYQLGKYNCKFKIRLTDPVLDMNDEMSNEAAAALLDKFNSTYGLKVDIDFDAMYEGVTYGDFFIDINDFNYDYNVHYQDFICNQLGFGSFVYNSTYGTDFTYELGDYGRCYAIYNPKDIIFVDGPF